MELHQGNNIEILKRLKPNSIDSIVTDPPYGLKFMNKKWDHSVPSVQFWRDCLRVLKPGGHVLSFGGTRTYHRMACNIEDAGFEIRDQIQWLYGSGFPKSHNISKAIDKKFGSLKEVEYNQGGGYGNGKFKNSNVSNTRADGHIGKGKKSIANSDLAKQWDGWGTALKPACEPLCLARKPLSEKTIVNNVLEHGTGGINIDECRVETEHNKVRISKGNIYGGNSLNQSNIKHTVSKDSNIKGRFPANVVLDEEAGKMLDEQSGQLSPQGSRKKKDSIGKFYGGGTKDSSFFGDKGGASRFFYCAKASKRERNEGLEGFEDRQTWASQEKRDANSFDVFESDGRQKTLNKNYHPTVKPIKLMQYLIKLITPPGGTIMDPFMGSGSTGVAAKSLGFNFIGMELNEDYYKIAEARINHAKNDIPKPKDEPQMEMSL